MTRTTSDCRMRKTNDVEEAESLLVMKEENRTIHDDVPSSKDKIVGEVDYGEHKKKIAGGSCLSICQMLFLILNIVFFMMQMATSSLHNADLYSNNKRLGELKIEEWKEKVPTIVSNMNIALKTPMKWRPFVYFHARKSGGSNVRGIMYQMAQRANITDNNLWLPCYGDRGCVPFSLPNPVQNALIYGSHLNFMHVTNIMREVQERKNLLQETATLSLENGENVTYLKLEDSYPLFDCVTTIRPTVKRVLSCWNYRFNAPKGLRGVPLLPRSNALEPEDFANLLPKTYDEYGGGCNNEMARIFGSSVDETHINTLSLSDPGFVQELDNIASRISKCFILRIDRCEDSNKIIEHFIPWMHGTDLCSRHVNVEGKPSDTVSEEAGAVILEQNYIDELIFNLGEDLFEKQLERATGS
mmetsp:Transcript_10875/g.16784  ORF Transcript_10875/g.16784 Transcript_10875/m.16784 type:complete len:414 (+) Transcript_10875:101-1342(+)